MPIRTRTRRVWGALLLGPLTIVSTSLVWLITFGLQFMVAIASFGAPGPFTVLLSLIALAGDAIVTFVSYRIYRVRGLAALTLAAALATQAIALAVVHQVGKAVAGHHAAERRIIEDEFARTVHRYAALGDIRYEVSQPLDRIRDNYHPELGPIYRTLAFKVPVTVREAGIYHLSIRYQARAGPVKFDTGILQSVDTLGAGDHELSTHFALGDLDYPSLWSPASTGGEATAELRMKVDRMGLIRPYMMNANSMSRVRLDELREMEVVANVVPWQEMLVDSEVYAFPGGRRYPADSRWDHEAKRSRLTDKEEGRTRRRRITP